MSPHKDDKDFKRRRYGGGGGFPALTLTDKYSDFYPTLLPQHLVNRGLDQTVAQAHMARREKCISQYKLYNGDHWSIPVFDGKKKAVFNYIRRITDKGVDFLVGNLYSINPFKGNEALKEVIDVIWEEHNDREILTYEMATMGGITGDCFVQVTLDVDGEENYTNEPQVKIITLDSSTVFPVYHPHDRHKMIRCLVQYPISEVDDAGNINWKIYTQDITATRIIQWVDDKKIDESSNPIGRINVVHIQNLPFVGPYGLSDTEDIGSVNQMLNDKVDNVSDIIDYSEAPTTLAFGIRLAQIEKGANKVWANLPAGGRIENLTLNTDLPASVKLIEFLRLTIHELTGTPVGSLGEQQPISNTSGVALHMNYLPLMEKTARKQRTYGRGIIEITQLSLLWLEAAGVISFRDRPDGILKVAKETQKIKLGFPELWHRMSIKWKSPLPKDQLIEMQLLAQRMNMGLESRIGALKEMGVPDSRIEEILAEVASDGMHPATQAAQKNLGGILTEEETKPEKSQDLDNESVQTSGE